MTQPLDILCVSKSTGGVANYNRAVGEYLARQGHRVHVVCLSEGREAYAKQLEGLGMDVTALRMNRYKVSLLSDLVVGFRLWQHMRSNSVSIAIAHSAKAGLLTRLAARLSGTPTLYVQHSLPFLRRVQGNRAVVYRWIERFGSGLGGRIVALTRSMRQQIIENGVATADDIDVIYTGIEPDRYRTGNNHAAACLALGLDPGKPVVGWAGRFNTQKNPAGLVEAAAQVLARVPETQVLMAGEGPLRDAVVELARKYNIASNLVLVPWQSDISVVYAACDVYVMTSRWEGLPLSLLEAMACECPVVASAVDGIAEVIRNDVDGLLAPAGDTDALADGIVRLLVEPDSRSRIAQAARQRICDNFTVEGMMTGWRDLVERYAGK